MNGKILYERLPNIQLQGLDDDVVKDSAPPFMVLEKCQDLCMRDRSSNNIVRSVADSLLMCFPQLCLLVWLADNVLPSTSNRGAE